MLSMQTAEQTKAGGGQGWIKWGLVVRPMVAASANCGQDPQRHCAQCGSAILVMFTAWGSRDGCDVIRLCVFRTHITEGLTVSVSIWRSAPPITVRDLQLVGLPSFSRYFEKMASISFILIKKVVKMYHPFTIVCTKSYSYLLIWLRNYQI